MLKARTRLEGEEVVITLPVDEKIKILPNQDYLVSYEPDGAIIMIPKIENPFVNLEHGALYEEDVWEGIPPVGLEILDD